MTTSSPYPQSKSEPLRFEGRDEALSLVLLLAEQAKKQICILSPDIDSALFDNSTFINTVSELARKSAHTQVRILVHSSLAAAQHDHRLISLGQRLTSSIHIHNTAKQHRDLQQIMLLVDDFAYLLCPRASQYNGSACLYDRLELRQLQSTFDSYWQQSTPDITVRRLEL